MPKEIDYHLPDNELRELEEAMSHAKQPEIRKRAMALRLLHLGHSPRAVAEMMKVHIASIYHWRERWLTEGINGLANRPKSGRPANTNQAYRSVLAEVIEQDPAELGYGFTFWTAGRLLAHMQKVTGIRLSVSRFRVLLKGCGYVYRQPTHDLSDLQDPKAREAAAEWLDWLKKTPVSTKPSSLSLWTKRP